MPSSTRERVSIAITTYKRPKLLDPLLDIVAERIRGASKLIDASILVIDNDPAESARPIAERHAEARYVAEHTPGIAAARQRALDETPEGTLLVYLDDDVTPDPEWLEPLVTLWLESAAAIVAGYVRYSFPEGSDPWVVEGGFIRRENLPTGTRLGVAAAGNILVDVSAIRRLGVDFDTTLGLSGGEDTLFTSQVTRAGGSIVWCQESVVDGPIPVERATRAFCIARAQAHGSVAVLVALRLSASKVGRAAIRARSVLGGLLRIAGGFAKHLAGRLSSNVQRDADGFRIASRGWGMARAAIGITTAEYRRATPRSAP